MGVGRGPEGEMNAVKWGLSVSLSEALADPTLVAELAVAAERAGWDGFFVWDHLWNRTLAPFADPFVTLAAIAGATERVRIGTLVVAVPRRRPQLVAQATTSLDRLSEGRMVLGVGLGVDSHGEYSAFHESADDDRARGAALDVGMEALLPMLAGEAVPSAGDRITTVASVQAPRVPIWVAGTAGRTAGPRRVEPPRSRGPRVGRCRYLDTGSRHRSVACWVVDLGSGRRRARRRGAP